MNEENEILQEQKQEAQIEGVIDKELDIKEDKDEINDIRPSYLPPLFYTVYIQTDSSSRIIAINSSAFLSDTEGWTPIDDGAGDRYHHAQGNYLPKPLYEERGIPVYKYVDGEVVERSQEEIDADYHEPIPQPSETDIALVELAALEAENAARLDEQDAALVELAALITGGV